MKYDNKDIPADTELEQSILRLVLVFAFSVYIFLAGFVLMDSTDRESVVIITGVMSVYVYTVFIFLHVRYHPGVLVSRRLFAMVADISAASFAISYLGEYGAPLFAVYPWVTIGNGFRYGIGYLITCAILSLSGFLFIATGNPYLADTGPLVWAGVLVLTVIPVYTAILLHRLEEEKSKAILANQEKSRFLANVSHELRTPLNAVIGFSELLDQPNSRIDRQRLVSGIRNSARSLLSLVEDVLDFSRIESGHVGLKDKLLDLHVLLDSVSAMFSLDAERKGLSLSCDMDPRLPKYIVGDEYRLRQILVNLVGNAVKFTEAGGIRIRVEVTGDDAADRRILFTVDDTGIGIPENAIPFIFDRFRQVDDSVRRQYGGTGLGTAISKQLVNAMDGEIGVESRYGVGSRFWFTVPCRVPQVVSADPEQDDTVRELRSTAAGPDQPLRVLVVEDSRVNLEVFRGQLAVLGITPLLAESGTDALGILAGGEVDVMILDIQMPGMSGQDVIRKYHERTPPANRVPIVVVTGDATEDVRDECKRLGVRHFLAKPVQLHRLRAILQAIADSDSAATLAG